MTLKNCRCGDTPEIGRTNNTEKEWDVHCLGCGIFIYAPTEEKCGQLWNDAHEAAELRELVEKAKSFCSEYQKYQGLCGEVMKPLVSLCEAIKKLEGGA